MPINKDAFIRYSILDELLSSTRQGYHIEQLLEKVNDKLHEKGLSGIKRRQLYKDISDMAEHFGAEYEKINRGGKKYYKYADEHFSIKWRVEMATLDEIYKTLSILSHIEGPRMDAYTRQILNEVRANIRSTRDHTRPFIILDQNKDVQGLEYLDSIFDAIMQKQVLKITYQRFSESKPEVIIFHPHCIREYNHRWFVLGFHEKKQTFKWVLALDRIQQIDLCTDVPYKIDDRDWQEYFENLIGVTWPEGEQPEEVKILFSKEFSPYVKTKPLHPTQKHRMVGNQVEVRIKVVLNYELENLILSYGQHAQVLAPERLKKRIVERLSDALKHYA